MAMTNLRALRTSIAAPLAAAMLVASLPLGAARAELVTTDEVIGRADIAAERARVAAFLARDDVRDQLIVMGVSPDEAEGRIGAMSDAEVLEIAQKIDNLPAGQASSGTLVIVLLLVIILVLLL
ncbi:MAG: PA2779 family protein [Rhodospirillales bacterium]|nr:MAG: PA2779 family protein [Rhodospirillales bacterium]